MALNGCEIKILKSLIDNVASSTGRQARVLMLGYPDILATEKTFSRLNLPVAWESILKRSDAAAVWKGHGRDFGDYPMCESKALIKALGASSMILDAIRWGEEDEIVDLNLPLSDTMKSRLGQFDIIIDPGTVEHCFNVAQAFLSIVDLLAPSGFVYHQAAVAFPNHGFWSLSPTAFFDFYESRRFTLGKSYAWVGTHDEEGFEPCFKPLDPFEILSDFPARIIGSFIFQKSPFGTVKVDGPYYPIQRCYSDKRRDIFLVDFIGKALANGS